MFGCSWPDWKQRTVGLVQFTRSLDHIIWTNVCYWTITKSSWTVTNVPQYWTVPILKLSNRRKQSIPKNWDCQTEENNNTRVTDCETVMLFVLGHHISHRRVTDCEAIVKLIVKRLQQHKSNQFPRWLWSDWSAPTKLHFMLFVLCQITCAWYKYTWEQHAQRSFNSHMLETTPKIERNAPIKTYEKF
jgi:hypothetical protein